MRVVIVGLVAVLVVAAAAVVVTIQSEPQLVSGRPSAFSGTGEQGDDSVHELEEVASFEEGRMPKEYGPLSSPDPALVEIHDGVGYVAYTTAKLLHVTAIDLDSGEVTWKRSLGVSTVIGSVDMTVTDAGLLFVLSFSSSYAQFSTMISREDGEDIWHGSEPNLTVGGVVAGNLVVYDREKDTSNLHPLTADAPLAEPAWSVPADGGRTSEVYQDTTADRALPRDEAEVAQGLDVGTNPDERQYIAHVVMYSGALSVRELGSGKVVSEGNAGEKMVDVVFFDDTLYVYRQTPRTLAAYAATDLSAPKWTVETLAAVDGSRIEMCAENLLCLMTQTRGGTVLHGIDTATGEQRWKTADLVAPDPVMAGEYVAVSHHGGTALLDPDSGEQITGFSGAKAALPGDGVVIGFDDPDIQLLAPGEREPTSLGRMPDVTMSNGGCEWTDQVALCAGPSTYTLWRYRG